VWCVLEKILFGEGGGRKALRIGAQSKEASHLKKQNKLREALNGFHHQTKKGQSIVSADLLDIQKIGKG